MFLSNKSIPFPLSVILVLALQGTILVTVFYTTNGSTNPPLFGFGECI